MKGENLTGRQDLVKCLEIPTETGDAATSYASKPSRLSSKLVSMLVDDLERFHVELEFHAVSGWRGRVRLEASVIDLHVVNVLITTLFERRGDSRAFLVGGGTVLRGSRRSGLRDEHDGSKSSENYLNHSFSVARTRRGFKPGSAFSSGGCRTAKEAQIFPKQRPLQPFAPFASFCSRYLASCRDLH